MLIGRRGALLYGAAAAMTNPVRRGHLTGENQPQLAGTSGKEAVLDQRVSLSLSYYSAWVYDVQTRRGAAQGFLVSSSPGDGLLTAAAMTEVTAAIQHAIAALRTVTSCRVRPVNAGLTPPWNSDGGPSLVFGDTWNIYGYNVTIDGSATPSQSWFAYQVTDVSDAVRSAFTALAGVASCTKAPRPTVTPPSVR